MGPTDKKPNTNPGEGKSSVAPSNVRAQQPNGPDEQITESDIDSQADQKRLIALQRRELARVSVKLADAEEKLDSVRYKLGSLIVEAFHHPKLRSLALPVDLIRLLRKKTASGKEASRGPSPSTVTGRELGSASPTTSYPGTFQDNPQDTILFVPINGTGLGHLTRCMAIANEMLALAPEKQVIFLTTSVAVPILFEQDFFAYHVPPRAHFEYLLTEKQWNEVFENTLNDIIRIHHPGAIVFDGTYPFDGLKRSLLSHPKVKKIWVKRELYSANFFYKTAKREVAFFDLVIVPGELNGKVFDQIGGSTVEVPPIVYLPPDGQLAKEDARRALRLKEDQPVAYVQLGSGNINAIEDLTQHVLDTLNSSFPRLQVVIGESPITRSRFRPEGRYALLKDFPNSVYFNAFDISILAAGYNSVYEAVFFHVPAIFLPRMVGTDNQLVRARLAENLGTSRVIEEFDSLLLRTLVSEMLERSPNTFEAHPSFDNGAKRAAASIAKMANAATKNA